MRLISIARILFPIFGLIGALSGAASAQTYPPAEDWEKRQNVDERLRSYGDDILGDQVDPHTGALVFELTDVSLPGNFPLEVALKRRRSQGMFYHETVNAEFADWQYVVPRVTAVTASSIGWSGNRCTNSYSASFPDVAVAPNGVFGGGITVTNRVKYSNGVEVEIPGAGSQQLLESPSGAQWPAAAKYVTTDNWWFECTTATDGGQGLIGHAPNGDVYTFNKFIDQRNDSLGSVNSGKQQGLARRKKMLAATLVTDKSGNTVSYNYEAGGARLTSITASDGRAINLYYDNATYTELVTRVVANGRTWTYAYRQTTLEYDLWEPIQGLRPFRVLSSVTQPDGQSWTFNLDGMSATPTQAENSVCTYVDPVTVTHPYGMIGQFVLQERRHRQGLSTMMPYVPNCPEPPDGGGGVPAQQVWTRGYLNMLSVVEAPPENWTVLR